MTKIFSIVAFSSYLVLLLVGFSSVNCPYHLLIILEDSKKIFFDRSIQLISSATIGWFQFCRLSLSLLIILED
jgi:hypothetical protein